jgi:hypothetical protein
MGDLHFNSLFASGEKERSMSGALHTFDSALTPLHFRSSRIVFPWAISSWGLGREIGRVPCPGADFSQDLLMKCSAVRRLENETRKFFLFQQLVGLTVQLNLAVTAEFLFLAQGSPVLLSNSIVYRIIQSKS